METGKTHENQADQLARRPREHDEGGVILKFKSPSGNVVGATVSPSEGSALPGWIGRCGTIITCVQRTPGYAAGQLRKKMKRAGFEEVKL